MTAHPTGTREDWLIARQDLLAAEKELTRRSDEVARRRQQLPWVRLDKHYEFDTDEGRASLIDLFGGRSQLLVYHFMFGPDYEAGCPSCSSIADGFDGFATHLAHHDVALWAVSRAPLAQLQAYKQRMAWDFPWASSADSDFNFDFGATQAEPAGSTDDAEQQGRFDAWAARSGADWPAYAQEAPGMSAFVLDAGVVHHTYSTWARGLDALWGIYQWLDRAPLGRNEPEGHAPDTQVWIRRHDEYVGS